MWSRLRPGTRRAGSSSLPPLRDCVLKAAPSHCVELPFLSPRRPGVSQGPELPGTQPSTRQCALGTVPTRQQPAGPRLVPEPTAPATPPATPPGGLTSLSGQSGFDGASCSGQRQTAQPQLTSMAAPTPAGTSTSRLVCSSSRNRKMTTVLKQRQSTGEGTMLRGPHHAQPRPSTSPRPHAASRDSSHFVQ